MGLILLTTMCIALVIRLYPVKNGTNCEKFCLTGLKVQILGPKTNRTVSCGTETVINSLVRRATPEVAGDLLSSFSLPTIPGFEDNPWLVGVCGLVVGLPLMIQKLVSLSKQLDAAAQTVENIADAVERVADEVDKAAEGLKEALPEGKLKEVAAYVEKLAENTSDGADKISDVMDMVEEIDDKLEAFLDNNLKDVKKT